MILAFAGGVGGAKLALGLSRVLPPDRFAVGINTGDDFVHLGLHVSPDIDTVTYTLAGIANAQQGWGLAGETWAFMDALGRLGGQTWFALGDRDLATHVERTMRLADDESLSSVTADFATRLGIAPALIPMSDDPVRTFVLSGGRRIAFQDYFVRQRCGPPVQGLVYAGATEARPAPQLARLLASGDLEGIVICPSNPFLSIAPILAIPGLRDAFEHRRVPVVAVSPIIGAAAVKGPAAKILEELGQELSAVSVARFYQGLADILIIDSVDASLGHSIASLGVTPHAAPILMQDMADRERVARLCVGLIKDHWR